MHERAEKAKQHFKDNWKLYTGVVIGASLATVTCLVMKNQSPRGCLSNQGSVADALATNTQTILGSSFSHSTVINHAEYHTHVKKLSYIVSRPETGDWWRSQAEAARDLGINERRISAHLNHGEALADGIKLVREGVSSAK